MLSRAQQGKGPEQFSSVPSPPTVHMSARQPLGLNSQGKTLSSILSPSHRYYIWRGVGPAMGQGLEAEADRR